MRVSGVISSFIDWFILQTKEPRKDLSGLFWPLIQHASYLFLFVHVDWFGLNALFLSVHQFLLCCDRFRSCKESNSCCFFFSSFKFCPKRVDCVNLFRIFHFVWIFEANFVHASIVWHAPSSVTCIRSYAFLLNVGETRLACSKVLEETSGGGSHRNAII